MSSLASDADDVPEQSSTPEQPTSPSSSNHDWSRAGGNDTLKDVDPSAAAVRGAGQQEEQDDTGLEEVELDTTPKVTQSERLDGQGAGVDAREAGAGEGGTAYEATEGSAGAAEAAGTTLPAIPTSAALPSPSTLPTPAPPSASTSSAPPMQRSGSQQSAKVHAVLLVSFDHALGPIIEFGYPQAYQDDAELNKNLPFLALPDGSHAREEDYSYFHLLNPSLAPSTIFGISCNRQIPAEELLNKDKSVTRSTVQKAIVVLASKPIFGPLRDKLGVITRTFFAQRDFGDKSILVELYSSFAMPRMIEESSKEEEREGQEMYMGTSLRELVYKFRSKTLILLKLLLLQRKVMFYSAHSPVESLCTFQYSLVALVPALLMHLDDAASPELDERSKNVTQPTSLRTSDKASLIRYLGLPLNIFGKGSFFQPYLPLQQIDLLQTRSFLVGTTNSIFQQQRDCRIDVLVRIESGTIDVLDPKLQSLLALTAADRKWMEEIVATVDAGWNAEDPSRPKGMSFVGSEDFLRAKFEEYICSLLACIKFNDFLKKGDKAGMLLSGNELDSYNMASFNEAFIRGFKATNAFGLWDKTTDEAIFDLVEPKHPMEGKTNPIEDVGIRLAAGLHDLHLNENLAPTREAISAAVNQGSESLASAYSYLRSDLSRRQSEWEKRRSVSLAPGPEGEGAGGGGLEPVGTALLAGVDVAKTGAASLATGIGSFWSSRKGLFAGGQGGGMKTPPEGGSRSASPSGASPFSTSTLSASASGAPSSSTSTSPLPSPSFGSFLLRPLSTNPLATSTSNPPPSAYPPPSSSTATTPSPSGLASGVGGFFGSIRKSFLEPSPSSTTAGREETSPAPKPGLKELELHDPLTVPRDLDAEREAKEERMRARRERELKRAEERLEGRI
ncbi:transport protein Avl9-domain-containing protein [Leucosporidium creatinivorum]|uniref:Transport protein Avl9-domain-containing protein n=1 Tax=Leucosporidium creatinivorum TaxID=106004 RepID=A0A1Y2FY95_9BASI|nr:transport protein Avl9-domain-containing protein [Leucosporidium creatinivorum]